MKLSKLLLILFLYGSMAQLSLANPENPASNPAQAKLESSELTYVVKPGDIFGKICQQFQPAGVPLKEVMRAVYTKNPSAFKYGDQAQIIVGSTLNIPPEFGAKVANAPGKMAATEDSKTEQSQPTKPESAMAVTEPNKIEAQALEKAMTPAEDLKQVNVNLPSKESPTKETQPANNQTENDWLNSSVIVLVLLILIGAYFRQRKLLIERRRKAVAELLGSTIFNETSR